MKLFTLFCAFFILTFSSCKNDFFSTDKTFLYLPEWPPEDPWKTYYPSLDSWEITVSSSQSTYKFLLPGNIKSFPLFYEDDSPVSVSAAPITCGKSFFHASGLIFPFSNRFSWKNGFAADTLKKFYLQYGCNPDTGIFSAQFNWNKFLETIDHKSDSENSFYNPWYIDQKVLLEKLADGKFSASYLNIKKTKTYELDQLQSFSQGIYLFKYIPQNFSTSINNLFILNPFIQEDVFFMGNKTQTAIINLDDANEILSLTFYDLPIK